MTTMPAHIEPGRNSKQGLTAGVVPALQVRASVEPRGNRSHPMRASARLQHSAPIAEESDESTSDTESSGERPPIRCKSMESLPVAETPPPLPVARSRSRSLDDLVAAKAEMELDISRKTAVYTPLMSGLRLSPRHSPSLIAPSKLELISKEEVLFRWKESERELLNALQNVLREKRALEGRLLLLQRVLLLRPP